MREAAVPGYRLSKARQSTRVLITLGMLGLLLGLLGSIGVTIVRTGIFPSSVQHYYLGTPIAEQSAGGLDAIMLDTQPRPFGELAEVTHLHVMGGSLMLFLLCHLLALCEIREGLRTILYVVSFGSFFLTFLMPWLIIYVSSVAAYLYGPFLILTLISLVLLCLIPLWEMWFSGP